ncbi:hypothetical protein GNI_090840 [Gregarina niphandrodes]|uniref:Uncharacterized protein n=1 Tax=Gregarina niphandrodes TaxID=110365 RepID=A0A023B5E6_GRENI|nr:hypothetical protein GNI_090840 [Gregarina niphandrodes]EZG60241.1 hypothetical protein GNI_090840 [Gregarina niphandrodes]|eukprot:XP_011130844.1 hypothetical protein GNI_090840 [Gregarina niphandrodes]
MGNCCSEDVTPYENQLEIEAGAEGELERQEVAGEVGPADGGGAPSPPTKGPSAEPVAGLYDDSPSAAPPPSPVSLEAPAVSEVPVAPDVSEGTPAGLSPPAAPLVPDNSAKPFVLGGGDEPEGVVRKPGSKAEEDPASLPPAQTRMQGNDGFALIYSQISGGTLAAKWVKGGAAKPQGTVAFLRITDEIDDLKLNNQPFQCGRNIKTDWINQAKAIAVFFKQCWALRGEVELTPEFNTLLPRRAILVFHRPDMTMEKIAAPAAIDTLSTSTDACAIMPFTSETFKGQATLKLNAFLEKAVRRGATVRF